jgi:hypothetical protein
MPTIATLGAAILFESREAATVGAEYFSDSKQTRQAVTEKFERSASSAKCSHRNVGPRADAVKPNQN